MASSAAESSHNRDEAAEREASGEVARQLQPSWVALVSIPVVVYAVLAAQGPSDRRSPTSE